MSQHQRPRQSVRGSPETRQKRVFTTFQRGGLGPDRRRWRGHLIVIIQSDIDKNKTAPKCCNQPVRLPINVTSLIELPPGIRERREMKGCWKQTLPQDAEFARGEAL
jgi:hypothetical protein